MPIVTYTNNPDRQGEEGVVYAPDLPWWVSEPQPGGGGYAPSTAERPSDEVRDSLGRIMQKHAPAPYVAGASITPDQVSQVQRGSLSLADITSGFVSPVYGGGSVETTPSGGFSSSPLSPPRQKTPIGTKTTSTSSRVFAGERPELTLPKRDERRVERLRQQAAGPGVRKLRTALSRALVRSYENPNVAKMITRSALAGYGEGLESVLSGASRTAESQYQSELGIDTQEAFANYQATLNEYMAKARTVTTQTTQQVYNKSGFGESLDMGSLQQQEDRRQRIALRDRPPGL